ncbi:Alpha/Beta hydrolase protein [Cadophora sp. MPI-SDFR-AT-0126]|nr:Alpha/Beta hydrolase protein [Leotiomycetes sp. MPI-SDFR-AT-0126]
MELTVPNWKVPALLFKVFLRVLSAALIGIVIRPQGWTYKRNVSYTLLRSLSKYELMHLVARRPKDATTLDMYCEYMKSQNLKPEVVELENGLGGGWIGSPKAKKVMLYFHGSGYVNIATPFHFQMLGDLVALGGKEGKSFSIFAVQYSLAPRAQYPHQITEAVDALIYLLETAKYDPEDIYVGGDSAGAHLTIALLSTLTHPHLAASRVSLQSKKLAGAFLISPWVTFEQTSASMTENSNKDFMTKPLLKKSSDLLMGTAKEDKYTMPLIAEPEWWKDLKVKELGVTGGEYELFKDDIENWVNNVKVYNPKTEYYLAPAEVHAQAIVDRGLRMPRTKSEDFFRDWMMESLGSNRSAQE